MRLIKLVGLRNYQKLWNWTFETDPPSNWYTAIVNMGIFGGLYVVFCLFLGLTLAILLDQKIRGEGILRPIYLYPLALSFIVTGTAWKLFLDPGIGLEKAVHDWGWTSFKFDWVVNPRMMIYCVAIAAIWQTPLAGAQAVLLIWLLIGGAGPLSLDFPLRSGACAGMGCESDQPALRRKRHARRTGAAAWNAGLSCDRHCRRDRRGDVASALHRRVGHGTRVAAASVLGAAARRGHSPRGVDFVCPCPADRHLGRYLRSI